MQHSTLQSCTNSVNSNRKHAMWMQHHQPIDADEIYYPIKSTAAASSASFKTSSAILHFLSAATILTPEKPLWSNIFLSVWTERHPEKHTIIINHKNSSDRKKMMNDVNTWWSQKKDEWYKYPMKSMASARAESFRMLPDMIQEESAATIRVLLKPLASSIFLSV